MTSTTPCKEMPAPPEDAQSGFAMVEAVAALLITSLLFVMLTVAASFVLSGSVRSLERINQAEILHGGLDAWQREVSQAANPTAQPFWQSEHATAVFEGRAKGMRFVAASRGLDRPLEIVGIEVQNDSLGRRSSVVGADFDGLDIASGQPWTFLLSGAWDYRFDYRGRSSDEAWRSDWIEQDVLPGFVRLTITDRATGDLVTSTIALLAVNAVGACSAGTCEGQDTDEELQAWSNADAVR